MSESQKAEFYKTYLNKYLKVTLMINGQTMYHRGEVIHIYNDFLVIDDIKLGPVPLNYGEFKILEVGKHEG